MGGGVQCSPSDITSLLPSCGTQGSISHCEKHVHMGRRHGLREKSFTVFSHWFVPWWVETPEDMKKDVSGELLKGSFWAAQSTVTMAFLIRKFRTVIFFLYFNYSFISEELFWIYGTFLTRLFWHFKVTQIQGLHNMASTPSLLYTQILNKKAICSLWKHQPLFSFFH